MRYAINFDKQVNRLVPYYIGGRRLILYLQALLKPLQTINNAFVNYAKEQRIEASVTSQIGYFEWFLNHKFGKYLNGGRITVTNGAVLGVPIYWETANIADGENMSLYQEREGRKGTVLYRSNDKTDASSHSFVVSIPAIDTTKITEHAFKSMLVYYIEKYRIGNKSYIIKYNS